MDNRFFLMKRERSEIDKRDISKDEPLRRRTRWAINYVAHKNELTNKSMAQSIGIPEGTLSSYRAMGSSAKASFVHAFCEKYNFNEDWFISGKGEPFSGACQRYPEVCSEDQIKVSEERTHGYFIPPHPAAAYTPAPIQNMPGIDPVLQAMSDLKDIFASGDPILIPAIQSNLNAFKRALLREQQFSQILKENSEIKEMFNDLKGKFSLLEDKIMRLEKENSDLRRRVNDIDSHGPENGGSNTEKKAM